MLEPIIAAFAVALVSLAGVFFFGASGTLAGTRRFILPFAIGIFLGVVFFELIPESFELTRYASIAIALGFLGFYALAHLLSEYHHHHMPDEQSNDKSHGGGYLILLGDAVHNFADGIVIAAAFVVDPAIGVATTLGIMLHELPQEIAEYHVLISAGFTRVKALGYNFLSALSVVAGAIIATVLIENLPAALGILLGIAGGNLLYIAASDLLPDLFKVSESRTAFWKQFASVCAGLVLIASLISFGHAEEGAALHEGEVKGWAH